MKITGRHIHLARAALKWNRKDLAERSGVAPRTIQIWEQEYWEEPITSRETTLALVVKTLKAEGIRFLNDKSPGVRLRPK